MCVAQEKEMNICGKMDGTEEFNRERCLQNSCARTISVSGKSEECYRWKLEEKFEWTEIVSL